MCTNCCFLPSTTDCMFLTTVLYLTTVFLTAMFSPLCSNRCVLASDGRILTAGFESCLNTIRQKYAEKHGREVICVIVGKPDKPDSPSIITAARQVSCDTRTDKQTNQTAISSSRPPARSVTAYKQTNQTNWTARASSRPPDRSVAAHVRNRHTSTYVECICARDPLYECRTHFRQH